MNRNLHSPTKLTEFARDFDIEPDTFFSKFVNKITNVYNSGYNTVNVVPTRTSFQQRFVSKLFNSNHQTSHSSSIYSFHGMLSLLDFKSNLFVHTETCNSIFHCHRDTDHSFTKNLPYLCGKSGPIPYKECSAALAWHQMQCQSQLLDDCEKLYCQSLCARV